MSLFFIISDLFQNRFLFHHRGHRHYFFNFIFLPGVNWNENRLLRMVLDILWLEIIWSEANIERTMSCKYLKFQLTFQKYANTTWSSFVNSYMHYRILFADCTSQLSLIDTSFPNIFYDYFRGVYICAKKERSGFVSGVGSFVKNFWNTWYFQWKPWNFDRKPWISIEKPGVSNPFFRCFAHWIINTWHFERNTYYFENLEFRLESWYREDWYALRLFLFFPYVWTLTKRRNAGLKN